MHAPGVDWLARLALVVTIVAWGAVPVMLRELAASIDPWTANGIRYPLAAVLFWPVLIRGLRAGTLDAQLLRRALGPALLSLFGQVLWAMTPYYLPASTIGFLIQVAVVWGLIAAMVLFPDERGVLRTPGFGAGLVLAGGGFVVLSVSQGAFVEPATRTGVVIILWCSVFFGLYGVSVRYFMRGIPPLLGFGVVAQYVSIGILFLMGLKGDPDCLRSLDPRGWIVLVLSSLLGIGLAHVLLYTAIQRVGASISTAIGLVTPFVTVLLGHVILGERLGGTQWAAGIAMVAGGAFVLSSPVRLLRAGLPGRVPAEETR